MQISVTEAQAKLLELIRRAGAGDEVIFTLNGHPVVRLVPVETAHAGNSRRALLQAARTSGAAKATLGPGAARSQDFLYEDDGRPGRSPSTPAKAA